MNPQWTTHGQGAKLRKIIASTAAVAIVGLTLAGCGYSSKQASGEIAAGVDLSVTTTAPAPAPVVRLANTSLGTILTDSQGRTLYAFTKDPQFGASTCFDTCAASWPAAQITDEPLIGEGVDTKLIGAIMRKDGTKQLTVNGWPLYRFAADGEVEGATKGQGKQSVWYVVSETGKLIKNSTGSSTSTTTSSSSGTKSGVSAGKIAESDGY